jgi:drug/metabolite transporter (DMT)-like permease
MTWTILLAATAASFFGCSDFFGGLASRRDSAFAVTANAHAFGLVVIGLAVLAFPAPFTTGDLAWGAALGVAGSIGVVALYAGLACGRMSVVAPITAALSGSLPALYDLTTGTAIRPLALLGLGLALVAIVVVSSTGHPEDRAAMPVKAIWLSVLSGIGFAFAIVFLSFAGKDSGFMPLLAARVVSVPLLAVITMLRRGTVVLVPSARLPAFGAGALDMASNVALISAVRLGPLAVASVIGSLYPVMTILLARVVLRERMHWAQRAGVAVALVAVVLAGIG